MATASPTLTTGEVAEIFGVTPGTVTNWKADGCPYRTRDGRPAYVLRQVIEWRVEQARLSSAPPDMKAEQLRKLKAEADRVELEVAEARGDLVPLADFDTALASEHEAMRAALTSLPSKFSRLVADRTGCTMALAQAVLSDVADRTMIELRDEMPAEIGR